MGKPEVILDAAEGGAPAFEMSDEQTDAAFELIEAYAAAEKSGGEDAVDDVVARIFDFLDRLTGEQRAHEAAAAGPAPAELAEQAEQVTADVLRTRGKRQKANDAARELLAQLQATGRPATDEEKAILARYSGNGGGLTRPDGKRGDPYEYYTPREIAAGMWSMLKDMGFAGGKVLDPSAGTGVFTSTAPREAAVQAVELDATSAGINAAVNDSRKHAVEHAPFERFAALALDESYDAIVTNVPFGGAGLREHAGADKLFQNETLEAYFILRSLKLLRPGGYATFIVPESVVGGRGERAANVRQRASLMAEFMGAYRLPNNVFDAAGTDVVTDVIVFRKHPKAVQGKVADLYVQNPDKLRELNVMWAPFIEGTYFKTDEGRRNILGTVTAAKSRFGEDIETVVSDQSPENIAKLMRRLPGSRIDWKALDEAEAAPIVYHEGDVIYQDGRALVLKDGDWIPLTGEVRDQMVAALATDVANVSTPLTAFDNARDVAVILSLFRRLDDFGSAKDCPEWLRPALTEYRARGAQLPAEIWTTFLGGACVNECFATHKAPFNYGKAYPALHEALPSIAKIAQKSKTGTTGIVGDRIRLAALTWTKKGGYHDRWIGRSIADVQFAVRPIAVYERLRYQSGLSAVSVAMLREQLADIDPTFDPMQSDEWLIADPQGLTVQHESDGIAGDVDAFIARQNAMLSAATDPAARDKIQRQFDAAMKRVPRLDIDNLTCSLLSPFIPAEVKLQFCQSFVDSSLFLTIDDDGESKFDAPKKSESKWASKGEDAAFELNRTVRRFANYLNTGTISLGGQGEADYKIGQKRMLALRDMIDKANTAFDAWIKANPTTRQQLDAKFNSTTGKRFIAVENGDPLAIPGFSMPEGKKPHPYQNAEFRKLGQHFADIVGFDVGLGKTLTALGAMQYAHAIGTKKRTIVVVPSAVLGNWRKEAMMYYGPEVMERCIFVGLTVGKNGKAKYDSSLVDSDLQRAASGNYSKIFMTFEAFSSIRLKDETLAAFAEYLKAECAVQSDKKAEQTKASADAEQVKSKASDKRSSAAPYLEDMGVDSIIIDEAHRLKNSMSGKGMKSAKDLSIVAPNKIGSDAQAKAWYIRRRTSKGDGVVALTATPVTNSPLEVFSMICLTRDAREVSAMMGGVAGGGDFLQSVCQIGQEEISGIDDMPRVTKVFTGLNNVEALSNLLKSSANIKTAKNAKEYVKLPEAETLPQDVELSDEQMSALASMKSVYRCAKALKKALDGATVVDGKPWQVAARELAGSGTVDDLSGFGNYIDPDALGDLIAYCDQRDITYLTVASPFNLADRMSDVILDADMAGQMTCYVVSDAEKAAEAVQKFNALGLAEKRDSRGPLTKRENATTKVVVDKETGDKTIELTIKVQADAVKESGYTKIRIDTETPATQQKFLDIARKLDLELDVTISPKIAAMIANFQKEQANPKHSPVKQIIFCDPLGLQQKIKIALSRRCGIPADKIAIINGEVNAVGMQEIQDGFNANDGEDSQNKYQAIIANKKGEVGINLQNGTQALHHLTIWWTPDSITQRNGRGVRQGNPVTNINVYFYDADGTFDSYKRATVDKKGDWIEDVISPADGAHVINIASQVDASEVDLMIEAVGDKEALADIARKAEERRAQVRAEQARAEQARARALLEKALKAAADARKPETFIGAMVRRAVSLESTIGGLSDQISRAKSQESIDRLRAQRDRAQAQLDEAKRLLAAGARTSYGQPVPIRIGSFSGATFVSGSELEAMAQQDAQTNDRLADQAVLSFKHAAEQSPGAYPADALERVRAGRAAFGDGGVFIEPGDVYMEWPATPVLFIERNGKLMAAQAAAPSRGFGGEAELIESPKIEKFKAQFLFKSGGPEAEIALRTAAEKDQAFSATGRYRKPSDLVGYYVPAVRDRYPAGFEPVAWAEPTQVRFRGPAFGPPIRPENYENSSLPAGAKAIYDAIVNGQRAALVWNAEGTMLRADSQAAEEDRTWASGTMTPESMAEKWLKPWLIAHQIKIAAAEVDQLIDALYQAVDIRSGQWWTAPKVSQKIEAAIRAGLDSRYDSWVDLADMAASIRSSGAPAPAIGSDGEVWVQGDTRSVVGILNAFVGGRTNKAYETELYRKNGHAGGRYVYPARNGTNGAPNNEFAWVLTAKAWGDMIAKHPELAAKLKATPKV